MEVGIGTGLVAAGLRALGHRAVGFDLSEAMLRAALQRLGARVAVADADSLPLTDGSVDCVILSWVLHLVADPGATLAEARRVVGPGGRVIAVLSSPGGHPDDEIGAILGSMAVLRSGRDTLAIESATPDGLRLGHRGFTPWDEYSSTPASQIDLIEQRSFSSLFDIDDTTWAAVVDPVLARLRALPDPDRPRRRSDRYPVFVWTAAM